jgi:Fur family ferric uptake transcriptional regulator
VRDSHDEVRAVLAEYIQSNGLKNTRQRDVILETFIAASGHTTIEELLSAVQKVNKAVGYATVYRTLKLFVDAGIASERKFGDGQTQYEIANVDEHHDHLICRKCGKIFEFEDDIIERQQEIIAAQFGLKLTHHRMTLWGEPVDGNSCC